MGGWLLRNRNRRQGTDGLEGKHTGAIVATKPWAREAPRNWTSGKEVAQGVSLAVSEEGVNIAAVVARKARARTGRSCEDYTQRLSRPCQCPVPECRRVPAVHFRGCRPVKGRVASCSARW